MESRVAGSRGAFILCYAIHGIGLTPTPCIGANDAPVQMGEEGETCDTNGVRFEMVRHASCVRTQRCVPARVRCCSLRHRACVEV